MCWVGSLSDIERGDFRSHTDRRPAEVSLFSIPPGPPVFLEERLELPHPFSQELWAGSNSQRELKNIGLF